MARTLSATRKEFGTEYGRIKMFEETLKKILKPTLKEVYAEGYNAGQEDTSRRMHDIYSYGYINGYTDATAKAGVIELDDIDGIDECLGTLVEDKVKEFGGKK